MIKNTVKFTMQSDLKDASDANCALDTAANHRDADSENAHGDDPLHFVNWPWRNAALVALVRSLEADSSISPECNFTFLSPTTLGLAALEGSDCSVEGLWLLYTDRLGLGNLTGLRIEEISRWPAGSASEKPLTVLHVQDNRLLGIDDEHVFEFKKTSTEWNGSGRYKRLSELEN
jgi:hypothetical protein